MSKGLESFKSALFSKKAMKKTVGGRAMALESSFTKTNCTGLLTSLPDCKIVQDCGDSDNVD